LSDPPEPSAWSTYRAKAGRTARATCTLSDKLSPLWTKKLGGDLTQATIAAGKAYVVRKDTYELYCLNLEKGETIWKRAFPAALDGPPTVVGDRLYLGSRDGRIHCLRASDGAMAWSFLAAPLDRLTLSEDRLESLWPVSSSVLYHNRLIYAVAGRNSYLDGGIRLYALDPATGAVRHNAILAGPWPDMQTLKTAVVTERGRRDAAAKSPEERESIGLSGVAHSSRRRDKVEMTGSRRVMAWLVTVYDLAEGKVLQQLDLPAQAARAGIAVAEGTVYITCLDGSVLCLR
jgi:outer membrane protein assembly factor BamB